MNLCFYCNKPKPAVVYRGKWGGKMQLHKHCVEPLKKLINEPIFQI